MRPRFYFVTDRVTGEYTSVIAPNRDAALNAYVKRRLKVTRHEPEPHEPIVDGTTQAKPAPPAQDD